MASNRISRRLVGRLRLASQGLLGPGLGSVPDAVRWMTASQAQDLQAALWAVGARVPGAGLSDVRAALDNGSVVRSWPMRGTLHLVAPEDLRWMLDLTAERLTRSVAGRHRELEIDDVAAARRREVGRGGRNLEKRRQRRTLLAARRARQRDDQRNEEREPFRRAPNARLKASRSVRPARAVFSAHKMYRDRSSFLTISASMRVT